MNVRETKEEIKRTIRMYLDKNEDGEYGIPWRNRRPVFMEGAPGIGKRAIVEQIAQELEKALVACSMTHYTRQSALGHSYVAKKEYEGKTQQVSEHGVGEIMGAVYETMEKSGEREGILFLDEINCGPENLMPAILLFLQHGILGGKRLPEGWVIVTSGTLQKYDRTARRFSLAVLDRLNCFNVEPDFDVWKDYGRRRGVHGAVMGFLELNRDCFYYVNVSADGCEYATPRGWEALSSALWFYERQGNPVDRGLVLQYVTCKKMAEEFIVYYERFLDYGKKWPVEEVLHGGWGGEPGKNLAETAAEERISVLAALHANLGKAFARAAERQALLLRAAGLLETAGKQVGEEGLSLYIFLYAFREGLKESWRRRRAANNLGASWGEECRKMCRLAERYMEIAKKDEGTERQLAWVRKECGRLAEKQADLLKEWREMQSRALGFAEEILGGESEKGHFASEWNLDWNLCQNGEANKVKGVMHGGREAREEADTE